MITELNERSREIFRQIVTAYMETGVPVGSRTLSRMPQITLSPASIRNVMADLEDAGLLYAPHTSAGRMPTETGLRMYIDGLMEVGNLASAERAELKAHCATAGRSLDDMLSEATTALSGLSGCAGLVMAPKTEIPLKHIEFVALSPGRALVVMVAETGVVENRIIQTPQNLPASALVEATNFLSAQLVGRTIDEGLVELAKQLELHRTELDILTQKVVEAGIATWSGGIPDSALIVRGQSHLLDDVTALADLDRIRGLFQALETRESLVKLLQLTDTAEGVQIFIGADNPLFAASGCSMVVSPFRNEKQTIVGAIGVVGPTRINYARIIPMVDFTAKLIGRSLG